MIGTLRGNCKAPGRLYSLEEYALLLTAGNNVLSLCSLSVRIEVKVLLQIPSLYEIKVGTPVTFSASL